jgi:hypothetical protein
MIVDEVILFANFPIDLPKEQRFVYDCPRINRLTVECFGVSRMPL